MFLNNAVGDGALNENKDVRVVQLLLNEWLDHGGAPLLEVDGVAGPLTISAIRNFQAANHLEVTGQIAPRGWVINMLIASYLAAVEKQLIDSDFLQSMQRMSPIESDIIASINRFFSMLREDI